MDFTNRNSQSPVSQPPQPATHSSNTAVTKNDKSLNKSKAGKMFQVAGIVLLFGVTILALAVIAVIAIGGRDQAKFISNKHYQAVFLTNGQVYFGNIKEFGNDYVRLQNIYYLQTATPTSTTASSTAANNNYTLVQLGCQQIHDPYNEMIINRTQVSFWENLQDNGQVVQKINQFKKQYPSGPDCTQVSSQTQASTNSSSTQPSSSTTTPTPSSSTSTTKNP